MMNDVEAALERLHKILGIDDDTTEKTKELQRSYLRYLTYGDLTNEKTTNEKKEN